MGLKMWVVRVSWNGVLRWCAARKGCEGVLRWCVAMM